MFLSCRLVDLVIWWHRWMRCDLILPRISSCEFNVSSCKFIVSFCAVESQSTVTCWTILASTWIPETWFCHCKPGVQFARDCQSMFGEAGAWNPTRFLYTSQKMATTSPSLPGWLWRYLPQHNQTPWPTPHSKHKTRRCPTKEKEISFINQQVNKKLSFLIRMHSRGWHVFPFCLRDVLEGILRFLGFVSHPCSLTKG